MRGKTFVGVAVAIGLLVVSMVIFGSLKQSQPGQQATGRDSKDPPTAPARDSENYYSVQSLDPWFYELSYPPIEGFEDVGYFFNRLSDDGRYVSGYVRYRPTTDDPNEYAAIYWDPPTVYRDKAQVVYLESPVTAGLQYAKTFESNFDFSFVGGSAVNPDAQWIPNRAAYWTVDGLQFLDPPAGYELISVSGVSNDGSVMVGHARDQNGKEYAFRDDFGTVTILPHLIENGESAAVRVSGDGTTVIGHSLNSDGIFVAVRWVGTSFVEDLGITQEGDLAIYANDCSYDGGTIVGRIMRSREVLMPDGPEIKRTATHFWWDQNDGFYEVPEIQNWRGGWDFGYDYGGWNVTVSKDGREVFGGANGLAYYWSPDDPEQHPHPDPEIGWYEPGLKPIRAYFRMRNYESNYPCCSRFQTVLDASDNNRVFLVRVKRGWGTNSIVVNVGVEYLQADLNKDRVIDLQDLNLVLANFGTGLIYGDANGDGVTDLQDLNIVLANFGYEQPLPED